MVQLWERLLRAAVLAAQGRAGQPPARFEASFPGSSSRYPRRVPKKHVATKWIFWALARPRWANSIAWDTDFKTGDKWPSAYFRDIPVVDADAAQRCEAALGVIATPMATSRRPSLPAYAERTLCSGSTRRARAVDRIQPSRDRRSIGPLPWNRQCAYSPGPGFFGVLPVGELAQRDVSSTVLMLPVSACGFCPADLSSERINNGNHYTADCARVGGRRRVFPRQGSPWLAKHRDLGTRARTLPAISSTMA